MKKLFIICFVSLSILGGSSCKKLLDTKPQDFLTPDIYFTKPDDAKAALGAAWRNLTLSYMYQGFYQYRWQVTDDAWSIITGINAPANLGVPASDAQFANRWNQMYQTIQYLNILLVNLPRIPMDETEKAVYRGEALFLRGFVYYELTKDFGDVPMRLVPTTDVTDVNYPATPRKEIYAQILKDLTAAEPLLPTTARSGYGAAGYAAKTTAQALLARVCLSMAGSPINDLTKFAEAREWAQKVVDSKEHGLNPDFTQVFKNYAIGAFDKRESLWEVDFNAVTGNNSAGGQIGYLDGITQTAVAGGVSVGQVNVTRKLILSYGPFATAGTKDLRRDWTCANFTWRNNIFAGDIDANKSFVAASVLYNRKFAKFRAYYAPINLISSVTPVNWPLIRYSDVLLMLAEAENEVNGPTALAYSCVNQVRARAWGKLLSGATNLTEADITPGLGKDAFREQVRMERYRELAGECLRKQDLIRWGIFIDTMKGTLADVLDPTAPAETNRSLTPGQNAFWWATNNQSINERDLLFPIPTSELQYNKALTQNLGW
jgi:hypothetical protein